MALKLYSTLGSPAVRGTLLTIRALGLKDKVEIIPIDLFKFDQLKPEFIAKNPCHTVPVLQDDDFVLWDSHAINAYLANKYAPSNELYPKDPEKRALVDQMAHFDTGYLFGKGMEIVKEVFVRGKTVDVDKFKQELLAVYDLLERILERRTFVAGCQMTLADFSIVATLTSTEVFIPIDEAKYPKIIAWYAKMKALPYYDINVKGVDIFRSVFTSLINKL